MKRQPDRNPARDQLILKLQAGQEQIADLLRSFADHPDWQAGPDAWSFRYVAAHLATVESECFLDRVRRIAEGDNPHFEYYLNTGRDFSAHDLEESLEDWAATRQEIITFVLSLPEEKWTLTGTHATFGELTLASALQIMRDHDQEHLHDLKDALNAYRRQHSDP